jgi:hypothetical protein
MAPNLTKICHESREVRPSNVMASLTLPLASRVPLPDQPRHEETTDKALPSAVAMSPHELYLRAHGTLGTALRPTRDLLSVDFTGSNIQLDALPDRP